MLRLAFHRCRAETRWNFVSARPARAESPGLAHGADGGLVEKRIWGRRDRLGRLHPAVFTDREAHDHRALLMSQGGFTRIFRSGLPAFALAVGHALRRDWRRRTGLRRRLSWLRPTTLLGPPLWHRPRASAPRPARQKRWPGSASATAISGGAAGGGRDLRHRRRQRLGNSAGGAAGGPMSGGGRTYRSSAQRSSALHRRRFFGRRRRPGIRNAIPASPDRNATDPQHHCGHRQ